jgi:hypothetical protein
MLEIGAGAIDCRERREARLESDAGFENLARIDVAQREFLADGIGGSAGGCGRARTLDEVGSVADLAHDAAFDLHRQQGPADHVARHAELFGEGPFGRQFLAMPHAAVQQVVTYFLGSRIVAHSRPSGWLFNARQHVEPHRFIG